jgi:hypothetical protein
MFLTQDLFCLQVQEHLREVLSVSMDTETNERPNIQIDDLVRAMTDEEYAEWLARPAPEPLAGA